MNSLVVIVLFASALGAFLVHSMASGAQDAPPAPPRPAPALEPLAQFVGTWDAEVELMGQKSTGVETCRMDVGGFWLLTDFEGSVMGAPFRGHGITGFDPAKQMLVGVWVDSMGGPWALLEGAFSKDGKTFTATCDGVDETGKPAKSRQVTECGRNERTFTVFQTGPDGKEVQAMKIRYKKRS